MDSSSSRSHFLRLPAELRLMVYEYLLVATNDGSLRYINPKPLFIEKDIPKGNKGLCGVPATCVGCVDGKVHRSCWGEAPRSRRTGSVANMIARTGAQVYPAILRCSKLLYQEAMPILYLNTRLTILLTGHDDVHDLLELLPAFPSHIAHVSFLVFPEMAFKTTEKNNMVKAVSLLDRVFNGYRPSSLGIIISVTGGNSMKASKGLVHEIFRAYLMMHSEHSVAIMSPKKLKAVQARGSSSVYEKACEKELVATTKMSLGRRGKQSQDSLLQWLPLTADLRETSV